MTSEKGEFREKLFLSYIAYRAIPQGTIGSWAEFCVSAVRSSRKDSLNALCLCVDKSKFWNQCHLGLGSSQGL